ncbi:hypothetical protein NQZ68_029185 [Dissostichus eleginoides]|nr:hypothetical protein NQZ68_029185 [Dissostichus eleginoides]
MRANQLQLWFVIRGKSLRDSGLYKQTALNDQILTPAREKVSILFKVRHRLVSVSKGQPLLRPDEHEPL